ncbi:MAG: hypothetical protein HY043_00565 [Verrucomicrobia bacterium]|nr:hypothetical protein [Verrucomicrobiota bacterium]
MSDRHQILDDQEFWTRLEYDASHWLESSDDKTLRRFWIDGFLPESITDTIRGADVEGTAWVGIGGREQWPYRFVVSVPQKMLHRGRQTFAIEQLSLSEAEQTLQIEVVSEKQVA